MTTSLVIGGGIAGLLAARVLSDHTDEVVIIEPDELAAEPAQRGGTPQSAHSHILLGRGREIVDRLFPDLTGTMVEAGAELLDFERDGGWFADGLRRVPVPGDTMLSMSRPFLEWHLRRAVLALPGVRLVRGRVTGLSLSGGRVDGVRLTGGVASGAVRHAGSAARSAAAPGEVPGTAAGAVSGGASGAARESASDDPSDTGATRWGAADDGSDRLGADLVVDASGRGSRLGDWLLAAGYQAPPKRRVTADIGYATCFFRRDPGQRLAGFTAAHATRTLRSGRPGSSSLNPVEGGRWMALITGYGDDRPTRSPDEFADRCRAEPAPMRELVSRCEPVGEVAVYRFPASMRRDFHLLDRLPAGLAAVGDAVASFNPVYGQGMTSAALHAEALGEWLATPPRAGLSAVPYFRRLAGIVERAWCTSTLSDQVISSDTAPGWRQRLQLFVRDRMIDAAITDVVVHRRFLDVVNMRARPEALITPSLLLRAVRAPRRQPVVPSL